MSRLYGILLYVLFIIISCSEMIENQGDKSNTGRFTDYYKGQSKKVEGNLIGGKKYGTWLAYDSLGMVTDAEYYYKDKLIKVLDGEDFNLDTITFDSNLITTIPNKWVLRQGYKGILAIVVKEKESNEEFSPSINFVKVERAGFSDLKTYVEEDLKEIQKHKLGTKVKEKEYKKSNDVDYCTLMYFIKSGNRKIGVRSLYVTLNNSIYITTCIAEAEDESYIEYKDLFNLVIENSIVLSS